MSEQTGSGAVGPDARDGSPGPLGRAQRGERGEAVPRRSDTTDLMARADELDRAIEIGGDRLDPRVVERVTTTLTGVRERLELGVDHTVVALVGGTGSGKSSLFNALTGFDFADVGVKRPTTSQVTACTWGGHADRLLAWLGIDPHRRIERVSPLSGDAELALRGLVLLDLPDHDSIDPAHREVVDRLLPMVDLLVWVVDPQKYADDALHTGYLRRLRAHEAAMLVVLNQMDTVPVEQRDALAADVHRLLVEDGLTEVPVQPVSTRTGAGIAALRDRLAVVAARRSVAAERAGAELHDAAVLLSSQVADAEPVQVPREEVVGWLAQAAGLPAISAAIQAVVRGNDVRVPSFGRVQADSVELARSRWLEVVGAGLPPRWRTSLAEALPDAQSLGTGADAALTSVGTEARSSRIAAVLMILASATGLCALVVGAVTAGAVLVGWLADRDGGMALPSGGRGGVLGLALLVATVVLVPLAHLARRLAARRRGEKVQRDGEAALGVVVDRTFVAASRRLLDEHRDVRRLSSEGGSRPPEPQPSTA